MAKKPTLTVEDKRCIEEWNEQFGRALGALEKAKQLNVGDYLVLYCGQDPNTLKLQINSYGAPTKYKVVTVADYGIPFIKKVNKKGTPVGALQSVTGSLESDDYRYAGSHFEFRLDPDFADALILEDEYDPSQLHKAKQEIFKAVTKHNKEVKINTSTLSHIVAHFQTVKIGDILWTSNSGHYLVQDMKTISVKKYSHYTNLKGPFIQVLTIKDKNGKNREVTADFFLCKALYRERPRTYRELKI
jgi:hypothetical protein